MYNSQKHSTSDGSNTDPKKNFQQLFWADWSKWVATTKFRFGEKR